VVAGTSLSAAVYAMEELEETARLYLMLRGLNPRMLTQAQVDDLVRHFGLQMPDDTHGHDHTTIP
jgi:ribulose-5-phosphate 4-epimerase/fuculose-1-phosphate aldolase